MVDCDVMLWSEVNATHLHSKITPVELWLGWLQTPLVFMDCL